MCNNNNGSHNGEFGSLITISAIIDLFIITAAAAKSLSLSLSLHTWMSFRFLHHALSLKADSNAKAIWDKEESYIIKRRVVKAERFAAYIVCYLLMLIQLGYETGVHPSLSLLCLISCCFVCAHRDSKRERNSLSQCQQWSEVVNFPLIIGDQAPSSFFAWGP